MGNSVSGYSAGKQITVNTYATDIQLQKLEQQIADVYEVRIPEPSGAGSTMTQVTQLAVHMQDLYNQLQELIVESKKMVEDISGAFKKSDKGVEGFSPYPYNDQTNNRNNDVLPEYNENVVAGIVWSDYLTEEKLVVLSAYSSVWVAEHQVEIEKIASKTMLADSFKKDLDQIYKTEFRMTTYPADVVRGTIRYINQYNSAHGWGNRAGEMYWECCTACESMALSYLGISVTPEQLLDTGRTFQYVNGVDKVRRGILNGAVPGMDDVTMTSYWGKWDMDEVDSMLAKFRNDLNQGCVSPVLIRYGNQYGDCAPGHWVMLVEKYSDGTYRAIGPAGEQEIDARVKINDGMITCEDGTLSHLGEGRSWPCHAYVQYSRPIP